jgi:mRNA interferase YafQ
MYQIVTTRQFRKSLKRYIQSGTFNDKQLSLVTNLLVSGETLPAKYRDHQLSGNLKNFRECHIQPDVLLVYQIHKNELVLILVNMGSHSHLFGK